MEINNIHAEEGQRRRGVSVEKMPKKWWRDWAGKYVVTPRYGVRFWELSPGKQAYAVEKDQMETFLNRIITEVEKGTYDKLLLELSKRERKNA